MILLMLLISFIGIFFIVNGYMNKKITHSLIGISFLLIIVLYLGYQKIELFLLNRDIIGIYKELNVEENITIKINNDNTFVLSNNNQFVSSGKWEILAGNDCYTINLDSEEFTIDEDKWILESIFDSEIKFKYQKINNVHK